MSSGAPALSLVNINLRVDLRYCISWNKQAMAESCAKFVRRDGTLVIVRADGTLRGTNLGIK
jgi:hypothetical protein